MSLSTMSPADEQGLLLDIADFAQTKSEHYKSIKPLHMKTVNIYLKYRELGDAAKALVEMQKDSR